MIYWLRLSYCKVKARLKRHIAHIIIGFKIVFHLFFGGIEFTYPIKADAHSQKPRLRLQQVKLICFRNTQFELTLKALAPILSSLIVRSEKSLKRAVVFLYEWRTHAIRELIRTLCQLLAYAMCVCKTLYYNHFISVNKKLSCRFVGRNVFVKICCLLYLNAYS